MIKSLPPLTSFILGICAIVALLSQLGQNFEVLRPLLFSNYVGFEFIEIKQGQLWRLISPAFIHFGAMHLIFNGMMFWSLFSAMEKIHNLSSLIVFFIFVAVLSNVVQYVASGPLFGGLSGVLFGVFGFIWLVGKLDASYPLRIPKQSAIILFAWFFLCWAGVIELLTGAQIANLAHTAGLVGGFIVALLWKYTKIKHYSLSYK